jgi:hypothetical protein
VLGAAALALTGPLVGEGSGTPAVSVLLPVAGTCALLAAGTSAATVTTRLLSWSPLVWIGDVSYSWYLWHWPLIVFATALWPSDGSGPAAVAAAVSLLPAWLSYRYVENPIRFNPRIQGRRVLALAATCVVVPIVACGGWRAVNSYMTNHLDTLVAVHDSRRLTAGEVRGCRGAYAPLPARPACTWTVPDSRGTAVLVGDSVAATLTEPFVAAANRDGLDATVTSVHGCPFADLRIHGYFPQLEPICSARYRESMAAPTRARPSLVVIGATSNYLWDPVISLGPATSRRVTNRTAEKQRLWAESLTGTIGRLNAAGIPVLVVQPTPEARELPSACAVLRVLTKDCRRARPRADVERELRPMIAAERQAVRGAQAATFDPVPVLCGTASCPATRGSAILFRDRQHLSIAGARLLTDGLAEAIGRLVRPA